MVVADGRRCKQVMQKIAINDALVAVLLRTKKVDAGMSEQQAEAMREVHELFGLCLPRHPLL